MNVPWLTWWRTYASFGRLILEEYFILSRRLIDQDHLRNGKLREFYVSLTLITEKKTWTFVHYIVSYSVKANAPFLSEAREACGQSHVQPLPSLRFLAFYIPNIHATNS